MDDLLPLLGSGGIGAVIAGLAVLAKNKLRVSFSLGKADSIPPKPPKAMSGIDCSDLMNKLDEIKSDIGQLGQRVARIEGRLDA